MSKFRRAYRHRLARVVTLTASAAAIAFAVTPAQAQSGSYFFTSIPDNAIAYPCSLNTDYNYPLLPILAAQNKCSVRVWFHQFPNWRTGHGGWTLCFSPHQPLTTVPSQFQNPQNIYISANSTNCPP